MHYDLAYEPALVPPPDLMANETKPVLEEWFRFGEEWSFVLRAFGGLRIDSACLEIGCALGRIAFPLRYVLLKGSYEGFDVNHKKIEFLNRNFTPQHPNFKFRWVSVKTEHNPKGSHEPSQFVFPYADETFDVVFATSIFTYMFPEDIIQYFAEAARVLKPGGSLLTGMFLLENYHPARPRRLGFSAPAFDFPYAYQKYEKTQFAVNSKDTAVPMTAYSSELVTRTANRAGLSVKQTLPGFWSGRFQNWVCSNDVLVFVKD